VEDAALKRDLAAGDEVILSTGATATVRRAYPAGHTGEVEILLDGAEERERVSGLTLTDVKATEADSGLGNPTAAQVEIGEVRAPSRKMAD